MNLSFLSTALLIVSLLVNVTVEALKKLFDRSGTAYSANMLAAIVSVVVSLICGGIRFCVCEVALTAENVIGIPVLMYLSFLTSTVGYDKVVQTLSQIDGIIKSKPGKE